MGADLVSLANNHAYDYGEVSLTDTLDTLEASECPMWERDETWMKR